MTEREAFEAWFAKSHYHKHLIENFWDTWQAAKAQAVPNGFVVVPKEPTQIMIDKFPNVFYQDTYAGECSLQVDDETIRNGYKTMIEAAQEKTHDN